MLSWTSHSQDITAVVKRDYEAVNKDNNFIYNDLVPDFGTLEPPGKATLAKPVQFSSPSSSFVDLFASLVPLAVSQALQVWGVVKNLSLSLSLSLSKSMSTPSSLFALQAYATKKDELINSECEKLRQATAELNE